MEKPDNQKDNPEEINEDLGQETVDSDVSDSNTEEESDELDETGTSDDGISMDFFQSLIERLGAETERLNKELETAKESYARLQADFDNYRRRNERERESIGIFANESLIKSLLPVLDNFDRALSAATNSEDPMAEGILLVKKQLMGALEKAGLTPIEAMGQPFDPNFHEAVGQVPADDVDDDTVVQELQKGYLLSNRLIRAAMVKVARN